MSQGDLYGAAWFGRPVKPLAIGAIFVTTMLAINQILALFGAPILLTPDGSIGAIGVLATYTSITMVWSWVIRSQRMYVIALITGVGAWVGRAAEIALSNTMFQATLPLGIAMMLAGSFVLEANDTKTEM